MADLPFRRGDRVRVLKGATLVSTNPKKPESYKAYRSQVVTVHHLMPGQSYIAGMINERDRDWLRLKGLGDKLEEMDRLYEELNKDRTKEKHEAWHNYKIHTQNPRVVWVGTGSYWVEADINNVEAVEDDK